MPRMRCPIIYDVVNFDPVQKATINHEGQMVVVKVLSFFREKQRRNDSGVEMNMVELPDGKRIGVKAI